MFVLWIRRVDQLKVAWFGRDFCVRIATLHSGLLFFCHITSYQHVTCVTKVLVDLLDSFVSFSL